VFLVQKKTVESLLYVGRSEFSRTEWKVAIGRGKSGMMKLLHVPGIWKVSLRVLAINERAIMFSPL
jgi:hypothetical protein